jgi:mitogen-activated protein kinase kinase 9
MPSLISSPSSHGIKSLSDLEKVAVHSTVLGHGNGGIVYKDHHKKINSFYALKVLHFSQDGIGFHQPPTLEAEIIKRVVDSPYIVRCHAVFYIPTYVAPTLETKGMSGENVDEFLEMFSHYGL